MSNPPPTPPPSGWPPEPGGSLPAPPPPGGYSQPTPGAPNVGAPPPVPGAPPFGAPQFGAPQFGAPQFGAPQFGAPPPGAGQPPAAPYQYQSGLPQSARLATPGKRIGGYLIDVVVLVVFAVICIAPGFLMAVSSSNTDTDMFGNQTNEMSGGALAVLLIGIAFAGIGQILYHIAFVAVKGQTPGAMAVKVKVVRLDDGQTPGWGAATMRWIPNLVGLIPYLGSCLSLGLWVWALVNLFSNERRQTPFDLAAKTVVIDVA